MGLSSRLSQSDYFVHHDFVRLLGVVPEFCGSSDDERIAAMAKVVVNKLCLEVFLKRACMSPCGLRASGLARLDARSAKRDRWAIGSRCFRGSCIWIDLLVHEDIPAHIKRSASWGALGQVRWRGALFRGVSSQIVQLVDFCDML